MRQEFSFLSKDGRTKVYAVRRVPEGKPIGVVQLVHGMVEYIGRYTEFADFLEESGFVAVGHDHVGHGHSVVSDEELGFFREKNPDGLLVDDMETLYRMTREDYPDLPYFILGHSMGSYLLREFLAVKKEDFAGAIIMGTGFVPEGTTNMGLFIVHLLEKVRGSHYRSRFVQNLSYSKPYRKYSLDGTDPENSWLSKNTENVKKYYRDPWCTYRFTVNGYDGLMRAVKFTCRQENADRIRKDLPILFVSGAEDPVGDLGEGVKKGKAMFDAAGMKDVTMKLYPDDRHEILNETDRKQVREDLLAWMRARM